MDEMKLRKLKALGKMGSMSPVEKEAKLSVARDMQKMAEGMMGDQIKGLKKVTVAAPDKAGLEEGLQKAQQVVGDEEPMVEAAEEEMHEDLDHDDELGEDPEHAEAVLGDHDEDEMDEDAIDAKLKELMAKKEMLKSKKMI